MGDVRRRFALFGTFVLIACAGLAAAAQPRPTAPRWRVVASSAAYGWAAVDARATNDVWAWSAKNAEGSTLAPRIGHWDGSRWQTLTLPKPPLEIADMAVMSRNSVWAAGSRGVNPRVARLVHWDGKRWSVVATPKPPLRESDFQQLPLSGGEIWVLGATARALGSWSLGNSGRFLVAHWDGARWKLSTPATPTLPKVWGSFELWDAGASSRIDIWAVGQAHPASGEDYPVGEHWDGIRWTDASGVLDRGGECASDWLTSITVLSPRDAWAMREGGEFCSDLQGSEPLHWDGKNWRLASTAGFSKAVWGSAIAATSNHDVWVAAENDSGFTMQHWDGKRWTSQMLARGGGYQGADVAALAPHDVWAVRGGTVLHYG
jgi:hypothetical protein